MTLKMWMKLLLSIATFVHGTDHMHKHLRGSSFKKPITKNKTNPTKITKKTCHKKTPKHYSKGNNKPYSETECLSCSPPKNSMLYREITVYNLDEFSWWK